MHAETLRQHAADEDDWLMPSLMALALHVAIVALLVLAGWWQPLPEKVSVAGPVVEAALVITSADIAQAQEAVEDAPKPMPVPVETAPPPQPLPEPVPQDAPDDVQPVPQEVVPEPDTVDQEAVAKLALEQEQAREREEQEARHRQDQVDLTEEIERQEKAERRQRQREQQLALRREIDEAKRLADLEAQKLEQLRDAAQPTPRPVREQPPAPAGGNNGTDNDLRARYVLALAQAIERAWIRPETISPRDVCPIRIIQVEGGEVVRAEVLPGCPYDALGQRSVEAAVLRAQPLPYKGFESVFVADIKLNFRAAED